MVKKNQILVESPGIYLFGAPLTIQCSIRQETVVLFSIPALKSCGLAVLPAECKVKETKNLLDSLHEKISSLGQDPRIDTKIFGAMKGSRIPLQTALHWLNTNGLSPIVSETGGSHPRKLLIECESGRVGLSYLEPLPETPFLTGGTARERNPLEAIETEILILAKSAVKRMLGKQAIEEHPRWVAATPKNPQEILKGKKLSDFPWSVVLLFDDLNDEAACLKWVEKVREKYPTVQLRWVGAHPPGFAKKTPYLKHLPPVDPLLLPEFKKKLARAVFQHFTSETSELFVFPKRKKKSA